MARPSYYVETPDGKKVQLDVPEGASAEQIRTLAARALKQKFPDTQYGKPALAADAAQSLLPASARGELKAEDSALSQVTGTIRGALDTLGVDERYGAHVANRATSALNDLTPVGDAVTLSDARDAWNEGNYGSAIGLGALAGVGLIPGIGDGLAAGGKAGLAMLAGAARPAPRGQVLSRYVTEGVDQASHHSPYSMVKMPQPHALQTSALEPIHEFSAPSSVRPEDLEGGTVVPLVGDRSATGSRLLSVNERELTNPVALEGGARYPHQHSDLGSPGVWASNASVTRAILNNARQADGEVYGVYSAMGPRSIDFSTMMADSVLEQIDNSPITKKSLREFDQEMRDLHPKFVGLSDPTRRGELEEQLRQSSALRMDFVKSMDMAPKLASGFPDIGATRYAISDRQLRDMPEAATGLTVSRLDRDAEVIRQPVVPHSTYPTQLAGDFLGGFETPLPRELIFPDFFAGRRAAGKRPLEDRRAFEIGSVRQRATPEWVDTVSAEIARRRALGIVW